MDIINSTQLKFYNFSRGKAPSAKMQGGLCPLCPLVPTSLHCYQQKKVKGWVDSKCKVAVVTIRGTLNVELMCKHLCVYCFNQWAEWTDMLRGGQ